MYHSSNLFQIERLLEIFESDSVNVEEVENLLLSYKSDPKDWQKFAKFDKYKYTRNLVHEGNGKFNLVSEISDTADLIVGTFIRRITKPRSTGFAQ